MWLALDAITRERVGGEILSLPISCEIVGMYIGARDEEGAQGLWDSLPPITLQCAVFIEPKWDLSNHLLVF